MGIVSLSKDLVVEFVPEYDGNREVSDDSDKTIIGITPMNHLSVQESVRVLAEKLKGTSSDTAAMAKVSQQVQRKQFLEHVKFVKNYTVLSEEGPVVLESDDVKGLYDTAPDDLIGEIIRAMESHTTLTDGQLKN